MPAMLPTDTCQLPDPQPRRPDNRAVHIWGYVSLEASPEGFLLAALASGWPILSAYIRPQLLFLSCGWERSPPPPAPEPRGPEAWL